MKILFTQHGLKRRGGTELFVTEVSAELVRRGHQVAVYAGEIGATAFLLKDSGVTVLDDPRKCPWVPDIIHGQHRRHALKALLSFPCTPAVLHLHGFLPMLEKPFRHPRILRYLTTAKSMDGYWAERFSLPSERFITVPNPIDLRRFESRRNPPPKPSKALLYSNVRFLPEQVTILRNACDARGMSLELAGGCTGLRGETASPEKLLPEFDLVFAVGRSALEAAACGCAVIPVYLGMAEEMLLPTTYRRLREQNLSPRLSHHHPLGASWITAQMDLWDPLQIGDVSQMVRASSGIGGTVSLLESTYEQVVGEQASLPSLDWEEELEMLRSFFQKEDQSTLRERIAGLTAMVEKRSGRIESMQNSLSWRMTSPLRWIDRLLAGKGTGDASGQSRSR